MAPGTTGVNVTLMVLACPGAIELPSVGTPLTAVPSGCVNCERERMADDPPTFVIVRVLVTLRPRATSPNAMALADRRRSGGVAEVPDRSTVMLPPVLCTPIAASDEPGAV